MNFIEKKSFIQDLPDELKDHIFKEFFELRNDCDYFLDWLEGNYRLDKDIKEVDKKVENILKTPLAVEYLLKKSEIIKNCYQDHFISNRKNFELMSLNHSFIVSILMYMWH